MATPTAMTFTRPALVQVIGTATYTLSDHDRSPLGETYEVIENSRRTARGVRRKYHIAQKRVYTLEWTRLPGTDAITVDGFAGADSLATMFTTEIDTVTLRIKNRGGTNKDVQVQIIEFEKEYLYRYSDDHYYNVTIKFEEV